MNRFEFTRKIAALLIMMIAEGERPIADYLKRSAEEQRRLFDKGLSKADGRTKKSGHQDAKALDIYFENEDDEDTILDAPKKGWKYWHDIWRKMGGKKMIPWDKGHFEG